MSNRDTEIQRNREIERQSHRESHGTDDTKEVPPLAARVKTLQEAVQLSLKDGSSGDRLFTFCRALRAFEITHNRRLPAQELGSAFAAWWNLAKPLLPQDADFDESRLDFLDTFAKTKAPLGANPLQEAIRRADSSPLPQEAARYASPKLRLLVAICYQLQLLQGDSAFFLGFRDAAKILGIKNLFQAGAKLNGLVRDGILIEVAKGSPESRRASRYRFKRILR
jgi:hypothetical protein